MNQNQLNICVMLGGPSAEREVSLRSGAAAAGALRSLGHNVRELDPAGASWQLPPETEVVFPGLARHLRGGRRRAGASGGIGRALHRLRPRSQPHRLR